MFKKNSTLSILTRGILCLILSIFIGFATPGFSTVFAETNTNVQILDQGRWAPNTYKAIQNLIDVNGIKSTGYNPNQKPYAVFDWDNTCVFNDTEESLIMYQINHLAYKMTPEEFSAAIRINVPSSDFKEGYENADKEKINIEKIGSDIYSDYKYLYYNYKEFNAGGTKTLAEIQATDQFTDFRAKVWFLYYAVDDTFGYEVSWPWLLYFFQNMTPKELTDLTTKSIDNALGEGIGTVTYTSPATLKGNAGVVSNTFKTGLRITPEITNLMNTLRSNGIDVYICTASLDDVIRSFVSNPRYGYNVPKENVLGMKLENNINGSYKAKIVDRNTWEINGMHGKAVNIRSMLTQKYGADPILICGDSDGDYEMMTELNPKAVLVVNRLKGGNIGTVSKLAAESIGNPNAKYLLQGRDEYTGMWIPSEKTLKFGNTQEMLLK